VIISCVVNRTIHSVPAVHIKCRGNFMLLKSIYIFLYMVYVTDKLCHFHGYLCIAGKFNAVILKSDNLEYLTASLLEVNLE
jgi:hypothetical protein